MRYVEVNPKSEEKDVTDVEEIEIKAISDVRKRRTLSDETLRHIIVAHHEVKKRRKSRRECTNSHVKFTEDPI